MAAPFLSHRKVLLMRSKFAIGKLRERWLFTPLFLSHPLIYHNTHTISALRFPICNSVGYTEQAGQKATKTAQVAICCQSAGTQTV